MSTSTKSRLPALLALAFLAWPRPASALVGDTMGLFGLDGSVRMIMSGMRNPEVSYPEDLAAFVVPSLPRNAYGVSQTLIRLAAGGWPTDWLSYEAHLVQSVHFSTLAEVLGSAPTATRYRLVNARWTWAEDEGLRAAMWPDRLNVSVALPFADLAVGRQAISFGKAQFWNPLDVFLAFDPFEFDRDYKPGVDALRLEIPIDDFSGVTAVGVLADPSEDDTWLRSAALLRVWGMLWDWDFALQGGAVHGGYQAGGAAIGEMGPLELRAEAAYFHPGEREGPNSATLPDYPAAFTGVLGLGRRFENTLYLSAEYLYNGAGRADDATAWALVEEGHAQHVSEHVAGLFASYELTPILTTSLGAVTALDDPSILVQPGLIYYAAGEVEIVAGAMLAFGERPSVDAGSANSLWEMRASDLRKSELGSYPHVFYVEAKAYF